MSCNPKTSRPNAARCLSLGSPTFDDHARTNSGSRGRRWARAKGGLLRSPLPVWMALFVNVLAFSALQTLIPIPATLGQLVTQGALIMAFLLALLANPFGVIRPNLFLVVLTILAVVALMVSIHNQFMFGSTSGPVASLALQQSFGSSPRGGAGRTSSCCALISPACGL